MRLLRENGIERMQNYRANLSLISRRLRLLLPASLLLVGVGGCRPRAHPASPPPGSSAGKISVWESPLHASQEVPLAVKQQRYSAVTDHSGFELHSHYLYQTVEIPLVIRQYHAYVQANWSGRQIECLVDTGASPIMWPQWLHLDSRQLGFGSQHFGPEGPGVRGEWVLSPHIAVGDLNLFNVPTEAIGIPRPPSPASHSVPSAPGFAYALKQPILGIFTFLPAVLTIDYAHKKIILRNIDYDVTRQPHVPHTLLLHYEKRQSGRIVLRGMLGGHKARFLLDTGEGWASVSAAFVHDHFASLPIQASHAALSEGRKAAPFVGPLAVDIGGLKYKALDFYIVKQVGEADVYLGAALFRACRVTIDPFRNVVLLESSR